ncbi:xylosidase, putative [Trichosporon asahii var. asahii CBS 8904]|uniref:Xylosidase, putative n=1 Tax=Trichosporon asahii var. asahii (strain CBS 8904) TaxID=1220162 RepID=K1VNS5_TRIAC|nr:xylosidase, putative [Trichosporon asahii var. asahii CBS 8904]
MPEPLVKHIYTADPSAHAFAGKIYVYPSHDRETDIQFNDNGDQYDMVDYHVLSMDEVGGEVTDHGVALSAEQVPWVDKQMWAPDCAEKNGKYYFYFPARAKDGKFKMGVAVSDEPEGPFTPQPEAMKGSFSIDPAAFVDDDGEAYLYFGGLWGGQLQCYNSDGTEWDGSKQGPQEPTEGDALGPRVARLTDDMLEFAEPVREISITYQGKPVPASDHEKRFFEAAWMHKRNGKYYFSYSTGDTHLIAYATGDSPYGPFEYQGTVLTPPIGWTNHHSMVHFKGKDYLFYHDCSLSKGVDHLRSVKAKEMKFDGDKIVTMDP